MEEIDEQKFLTHTVAPHAKSTYSNEFEALLKKERRCFKCLERDHRLNQTEACKQSISLSFEEIKSLHVKKKAVEKK